MADFTRRMEVLINTNYNQSNQNTFVPVMESVQTQETQNNSLPYR